MGKKHEIKKRCDKLIKGLVIEWIDRKPLEDEEHEVFPDVTHKNPILRPQALAIFQSLKNVLTSDTKLFWEVETACVFKYENDLEQEEITQLNAHCVLDDLNAVVLKEIENDMRYGDNFSHVRFRIECHGINQKKVNHEHEAIC
jgi:hypothetical protein